MTPASIPSIRLLKVSPGEAIASEILPKAKTTASFKGCIKPPKYAKPCDNLLLACSEPLKASVTNLIAPTKATKTKPIGFITIALKPSNIPVKPLLLPAAASPVSFIESFTLSVDSEALLASPAISL